MTIYYLINPELGWDNVCGMGKTLKKAAQDFYEDEDLSELTDEEIKIFLMKNDIMWDYREIED